MNSTTRRGFFGWMAGAVATLTGAKADAHWWPSLDERGAELPVSTPQLVMAPALDLSEKTLAKCRLTFDGIRVSDRGVAFLFSGWQSNGMLGFVAINRDVMYGQDWSVELAPRLRPVKSTWANAIERDGWTAELLFPKANSVSFPSRGAVATSGIECNGTPIGDLSRQFTPVHLDCKKLVVSVPPDLCKEIPYGI